MTVPSTRTQISVATTSADADVAAAIIAGAFQHLGACRYLVPDERARITVLTNVFSIQARQALTHGTVYLAARSSSPDDCLDGSVGAAVWFTNGLDLPEPDDYDARLKEAAGPYTDRFQQLDLLFATHHPHHRRHAYLAFLAVLPTHQNTGIGGDLLRAHHAHLDALGVPAYLEAADPRSHPLYARHHYRPPLQVDPQFSLAEDAVFTRLWREPQRPAEPGEPG